MTTDYFFFTSDYNDTKLSFILVLLMCIYVQTCITVAIIKTATVKVADLLFVKVEGKYLRLATIINKLLVETSFSCVTFGDCL